MFDRVWELMAAVRAGDQDLPEPVERPVKTGKGNGNGNGDPTTAATADTATPTEATTATDAGPADPATTAATEPVTSTGDRTGPATSS